MTHTAPEAKPLLATIPGGWSRPADTFWPLHDAVVHFLDRTITRLLDRKAT